MALRHALIFLVASASLLAAPAAPAQQVEGIAAVVNDEPITTLDVRDRMRLIISSAGITPDEETLARIQEQAIRGLIEETLQLQQAREFDLEVEEAEVDQSIADLAARNGATVGQYGRSNDAIVAQHGRRNSTVVGQNGAYNYADTYQNAYSSTTGVAQIGGGHTAVTTQTGSYNGLGVIQVGEGQTANVRQSGRGNVTLVIQGDH